MAELVPTLLCINARYAQHAAVCLVSLLENNPELAFDIVVATSEPLGSAEQLLMKSVSEYARARLKISYAKPSRELSVHGQHRTIDTFSRLWVAEFFPETVEKVLYLDSDIVVVGPIDDLWQTTLGDHVRGATAI